MLKVFQRCVLLVFTQYFVDCKWLREKRCLSQDKWQVLEPQDPWIEEETLHLKLSSVHNALSVCFPFLVLRLSSAGLVHVITVSVKSYVSQSVHVWKMLFPWNHPLPLALKIFLHSFSTSIPNPWGDRFCEDTTFNVGLMSYTCSIFLSGP